MLVREKTTHTPLLNVPSNLNLSAYYYNGTIHFKANLKL